MRLWATMAGTMASRRGRPRAMPVLRRKVRRGRNFFWINMMLLPGLEGHTLYSGEDEVVEAMAVGFRLPHDIADGGLVARVEFAT